MWLEIWCGVKEPSTPHTSAFPFPSPSPSLSFALPTSWIQQGGGQRQPLATALPPTHRLGTLQVGLGVVGLLRSFWPGGPF